MADFVLADECEGARNIIRLLMDAGNTENVVVLGRSLDHPADEWFTVAVQRRLAGIWDTLRERGVMPIAQLHCRPWSVINGYQAIHDLLQANIQPRAIICLNDRLAFGAYRALGEAGLKAGRDVAVVSFDDDDIAVYLDPMLTTAVAPFEEMGAQAVRVLLDGEHAPGEHLVPMRLRVRGSVKVPEKVGSRIEHLVDEPNWVR